MHDDSAIFYGCLIFFIIMGDYLTYSKVRDLERKLEKLEKRDA